jgi:hypothetical protein
MKHHIITVTEYNKQADEAWTEYCAKCRSNSVEPQKRSNFNQFMKFPYKTGFVVDGTYPLYYRTKKQALKTLGLA